jgi:hypothetical protein
VNSGRSEGKRKRGSRGGDSVVERDREGWRRGWNGKGWSSRRRGGLETPRAGISSGVRKLRQTDCCVAYVLRGEAERRRSRLAAHLASEGGELGGRGQSRKLAGFGGGEVHVGKITGR